MHLNSAGEFPGGRAYTHAVPENHPSTVVKSPVFPDARLALEDGTVYLGSAFGVTDRALTQTAEVVFNTAMTGYQEALTDPSYSGQILVMTAPLIGNTGINEEDVESAKVQVSGFVVRELARLHSNFRATTDLSTYLSRSGILGITGIDTRSLTRRLRTRGVMRGVISNDHRLSDVELVEVARNAPDMSGQNLVPLVGCSSSQSWSETLGDWAPDDHAEAGTGKRLRVLAMDCGAKRNILRNLSQRGCDVEVVPHTISAKEIRDLHASGRVDGLFISNGPGDPAAVENTIATLRDLLAGPSPQGGVIPTFGICLGHQLLALAMGAKTYKLKFGHRGANQPVLNSLTGQVEISSQNHGFGVDPDSLPGASDTNGPQAVPTHVNLNDHTLAGFCTSDRPIFSVQYHPEASPGPHDGGYLFDTFVQMMRDKKPLAATEVKAKAV
ncbi:MAG: glutamine-hydrolyzing carbamoyl-phosphate synthase small subunit [Pyrinomonadaceae bacterium]|nr:glutamine-hydrolyzing carbamoyl-phosphate synthase small subunit [Phycisphaerales bacterium]